MLGRSYSSFDVPFQISCYILTPRRFSIILSASMLLRTCCFFSFFFFLSLISALSPSPTFSFQQRCEIEYKYAFASCDVMCWWRSVLRLRFRATVRWSDDGKHSGFFSSYIQTATHTALPNHYKVNVLNSVCVGVRRRRRCCCELCRQHANNIAAVVGCRLQSAKRNGIKLIGFGAVWRVHSARSYLTVEGKREGYDAY